MSDFRKYRVTRFFPRIRLSNRSQVNGVRLGTARKLVLSAQSRAELLDREVAARLEGGRAAIRSAAEIDGKRVRAIAAKCEALHHRDLQPLLQMAEVQPLLAQMREAASSLASSDGRGINHLAKLEQLDGELNLRLRAAHERLAAAETDSLVDSTQESLDALGYEVATDPRRGGVVVVGRKGTQSVWCRVSAQAGLEVDLGGFDGDSCTLARDAFETELRKRQPGIALHRSIHHGQRRGPLIRELQQGEAAPPPAFFNPLACSRGRSSAVATRKQRVAN